MNNHKIYETIEYGIVFKNLAYNKNDKNDYKFVNKFIKKYKICKAIQKNASTDAVIGHYHPYYNPGKDLSEITYYYNEEIICSVIEDDKDSQKIILTAIRKIKLQRLKEIILIE